VSAAARAHAPVARADRQSQAQAAAISSPLTRLCSYIENDRKPFLHNKIIAHFTAHHYQQQFAEGYAVTGRSFID
jgi:hypothetical protein